jgi:hypothetical protein
MKRSTRVEETGTPDLHPRSREEHTRMPPEDLMFFDEEGGLDRKVLR